MKMFAVATLILAVSMSQAAQFKTCVKEVTQECGTLEAALGALSVDGTSCRIVQAGTREDGSRYGKKVVFKDTNTLYSVDTSTCEPQAVQIYGQFKDAKEFAGRLFNVTADGHVVVVGRDNRMVYLINSRNKPYVSVKSVKVDQQYGSLTLTFDNNQTLELDAQDVLAKLNHPAAIIY